MNQPKNTNNSKKPKNTSNPLVDQEDWQPWFEQDNYYQTSRKNSKNIYFSHHKDTHMSLNEESPKSQNSQTTQTSIFSTQWLKRYQIPLIGTFSIVVLLIIATLVSFQLSHGKSEVAKKDDQTIDNTKIKEFADAKQPKIISASQLSSDQDKSDTERAQNRIALLTNNTPYEEITQAKTTSTATTAASQNAQPQNAQTSASTSKQAATLNSVEAAQLVKANNIDDSNIWFTQYEEYYTSGFGNSFGPDFDITKPYISKSWSTANQNKSIIEQNGKIFSLALSTPDSAITYLGGKYALEEKYSEPVYFSGIGFNISNYANADLSFYQSIISDSNYWKNTGTKTKDGKDYSVYESSFSSSTGDSITSTEDKTVLYIDPVTFRIVYSENYVGGNLTSYSKAINSEAQTVNNLNDIFNVKELGSKEIKTTTTSPGFSGYNSSNNAERLRKVAQNYTILGTQNAIPYSYSIYDASQYAEYYALSATTDYDPSYKDEYGAWYIKDEVDVSFNQNDGNSYLNYTIFKSQTDLDKHVKNSYDYTSSDIIKAPLNVSIKINGTNVTVNAITYQNVNSQYSSYVAQFVYNKQFYLLVIPQDPSNNLVPAFSSIELTAFTSDQIAVIGQEIDNYNNSIVNTKQAKTIDEVPQAVRYISTKAFDELSLELSSIDLPTKSPKESTCQKYIAGDFELKTCLLERFGGASYYYSSPVSSTDYRDATITILNTSYDTFDIKKECAAVLYNRCSVTVDKDQAASDTPAYVTITDTSYQAKIAFFNINGKVAIAKVDSVSYLAPTVALSSTQTFDSARVNKYLEQNQITYQGGF